MAGSSFFKRVRNVSGMLAIILPLLALSGCGEGDGPTRILGTAATPLPPGFEDIPPTLGVFSETHTDPVVTIQDIQQAGNEVVITTETVRVFEGAVSLGLTFTTGGQGFGGSTILFDDADLSTYNTLKFSIDTSSFANFANLTVQLEPPAGGTPGAFVALADYMPVATAGGWETYEIPLSAFPAVNLALVNKLGFFNARDGGDVLLAGTLYLDDIHFTVTDLGGSGAAGTPIDPEVVLYATEGDPDLVIPDDYDDVTDLGSGSVIDLFYADDDTYSKVLSVFSGTNNGANIAKVGFIGFDPGFVTFYEDLIFKVKGMPNFVVFVTLYEGGNRVRINLTSSGFAEELDNGWYQVSIPILSFNGLTTATGIVFESDDTAEMQFRMLLTDIGFTEADGGGDGGNGSQQSLGVFSETNTDPSVAIINIASAGNTVGIDGASTAVTPFDGAVSLALTFSDNTEGNFFGGAVINFEEADLSAYDTLKFSIDTSAYTGFSTMTVQLELPGGGAAGTFVSLADYTAVATSGNWDTYEIPLADFPAINPAAVIRLGFFNARDAGDNLIAGTLYLDDIHFTTAGGGNGGATDPVAVVFDDDYGAGVSFAPFGGSINDVTVDTAEAYSGTAALKVVVPSAEYTGGALVVDPGRDVSAYDVLTFWAKASAARTLNVAGIGNDGMDTTNATEVTNLALTTEWQQFTITIPDPSVLTANKGLFHFAEGSDEGVYTIWFDEITYVSSGGGGNGGGTIEGNLVPDGGFEAAGSAGSFQEPWFVFENGGTVTVSSANSNGGTYAARLQADATSGSPSFPQLKVERLGAGSLAGGESVTVSFDVIDVDTTGAGKTFVAELFTELADPPGGATNEVIIGGYDLTGSWANRSITTNLGADAAGGVSLLFKADCGANTACTMDVFIDNVSIVIN